MATNITRRCRYAHCYATVGYKYGAALPLQTACGHAIWPAGLASHKHLLQQAFFEGLGEGDLGGDVGDFGVEGSEEGGDFLLFGY